MLTQTFSRALGSSQSFVRSVISLRQLLATDVHRCLALQDTLTEAEKKFISIRSGDEFKELTAKGVMMGAFIGDRLVAQSGTNLVSADHDYIVFEEATGMSAMPKTHFEVGASIVSKCCQGQGLQATLFDSVCKRVEELKKGENMLFTAACHISNLASAKNILRAGFKLSGVHCGMVNDTPLESLIFAKPSESVGAVFEKTGTIEASTLEKTDIVQKILKSGNVISRSSTGEFITERLI